MCKGASLECGRDRCDVSSAVRKILKNADCSCTNLHNVFDRFNALNLGREWTSSSSSESSLSSSAARRFLLRAGTESTAGVGSAAMDADLKS